MCFWQTNNNIIAGDRSCHLIHQRPQPADGEISHSAQLKATDQPIIVKRTILEGRRVHLEPIIRERHRHKRCSIGRRQNSALRSVWIGDWSY
eukprot:scaffold586_cov192-Alexandrium_tamarense.AAC.7